MGKFWALLFGATMAGCFGLCVVAYFVPGWWLPEQASAQAQPIDYLFHFVWLIVAPFFVLTETLLVVFLYRYATRPDGTPAKPGPSVIGGLLKPLTQPVQRSAQDRDRLVDHSRCDSAVHLLLSARNLDEGEVSVALSRIGQGGHAGGRRGQRPAVRAAHAVSEPEAHGGILPGAARFERLPQLRHDAAVQRRVRGQPIAPLQGLSGAGPPEFARRHSRLQFAAHARPARHLAGQDHSLVVHSEQGEHHQEGRQMGRRLQPRYRPGGGPTSGLGTRLFAAVRLGAFSHGGPGVRA